MGRRAPSRALLVAAAMLAFAPPAPAAENYDFDASQYEKRPFELNGYLEIRPERFQLDPSAAFYKLNFAGQPPRDSFDRRTAAVELSGIYRHDGVTFNFVAHATSQHDFAGGDDQSRLYEGYLTWQAGAGTALLAGRKAPHWGKGYAWNPVAFVDRPKDPNDPELSREGFDIVGAEAVKSLEGPLQTVALSALLVPTDGSMNGDFGAGHHVNPAAKLYLLFRDTDIDFTVLGRGSRAARYGIDFSRNLTPSFEIHGEWARVSGQPRLSVGADGLPVRESVDATSFLFGLRYLTDSETTWIVEYYRNGAGYTESEMARFYTLVDRASSTGNTALLQQARAAASGGFAQPNPMREYVYLRVSQKDPFDQLYWTPALTVIANAADRSYSIAPEIAYTGITDFDLRLRLFFLRGGSLTDFGERQNDRRLELRARYYF